MNRIKEINFADAIAIVEPGVITAELKGAARAQKLFYPPDPASMKDCSIGGNIATNAGGPHCLKYGVTRNYVTGLEVLLANGDVLQTGGRADKKPNALEMATGEENCEKLWALRRQFSNSLRATGLTKLNQDVVVPRSRIVDLVEFAVRLHANYSFPIACFGHAGDGNIHINIMADRYNRDAAA